MNAIVGIDPGRHGGLAFLYGGTQPPVLIPMPILEKGLNAGEIREYLKDVDDAVSGALFIYIESVHAMPGQGVTSMFNFGYSAGHLRGIVDGLNLPVRMVGPVSWKRWVLGHTYTHNKRGAIAFCQATYPGVSLIPPNCRVPHDGIADALCIATYGYQKEFGNGKGSERKDL